MTEPIRVYGCLICDIEYKDDKEALKHWTEFNNKGDPSHVARLVKLIGVAQKPRKIPKSYKNKSTKMDIKKLELNK
jgi:hypothetical protein